MKEYKFKFEVEGKEYEMIVNLNVLQELQEKYGSIKKWGELTDGQSGEVDIEALRFGYTKMLNEAIEINNDENGTNTPLFNEKQAGRLITKIGMKKATENLNEAFINGTKTDEPKNV